MTSSQSKEAIHRLFGLLIWFLSQVDALPARETGLTRRDYLFASYIYPVQPKEHNIPKLHLQGLFEGDIEGIDRNSIPLWGRRSGDSRGNGPTPTQHSALRNINYHWRRKSLFDLNVRIPVVIGRGFSARERAVLGRAMSEFAENTCVVFVSRVNEDNYIYIQRSLTVCSSWVGMVGGRQIIKLSSGCIISTQGPFLGIVQHELLHSLGFWHEHSRPDRDDYVQIIWKNIPRNLHFDYAKKPLTEVSTLQTPYDYSSVMHYSPSSGLRAIRPEGAGKMGNKKRMSDIDIQRVNRLYHCPSRTGNKVVQQKKQILLRTEIIPPTTTPPHPSTFMRIPRTIRAITLPPIRRTTPVLRRVQSTLVSLLREYVTIPTHSTSITTSAPTTPTTTPTTTATSEVPDRLARMGVRPAVWTCVDTMVGDCVQMIEEQPGLCDGSQFQCYCMASCGLCDTEECAHQLKNIAQANAEQFDGFCRDFTVDCESRIARVGWGRFCKSLVNKCECRFSCNACSYGRCPAPGNYRQNWALGKRYG